MCWKFVASFYGGASSEDTCYLFFIWIRKNRESKTQRISHSHTESLPKPDYCIFPNQIYSVRCCWWFWCESSKSIYADVARTFQRHLLKNDIVWLWFFVCLNWKLTLHSSLNTWKMISRIRIKWCLVLTIMSIVYRPQ